VSPATEVAPPEIEQALQTLVTDLRAAGGENVLGIALYGGLVKGRFTPGISDLNILVVVRDTGLASLEALAPVLTAARRAHLVTAFVATADDLRHAARLFPTKIKDMQAAHRVLFGQVGLDAIAVQAQDLRFRALQDLRNTEFRLRQRAVERGADIEVLWGGVLRSLPKVAVILELTLRLRGETVPGDRPGLLRAAARALGIAALAKFAAIHRHERRPDDAAARALVSEYLQVLATLSARIEQEFRP